MINPKRRRERSEGTNRKRQTGVKMFSVIELAPSLMSRKVLSRLKEFADDRTWRTTRWGRSSDCWHMLKEQRSHFLWQEIAKIPSSASFFLSECYFSFWFQVQSVCDSWNLTYFFGARKKTNFMEEMFYFVWSWYCLNSQSRCETRWLFANPQNLLFVEKSNFRENPLPGRFMKAVLYPLKSPCLYPINPGGVTFLQGRNTNTTGG